MSLNMRLFDGTAAESILEEQLEDAGVLYKSIGWDHYDNSIELYGVPSKYRLDDKAIEVIRNAGFAIAFVNHVDKWETHYAASRGWKGWRVSYPHKRKDGDDTIWLEEDPPESWGGKFKFTMVDKKNPLELL